MPSPRQYELLEQLLAEDYLKRADWDFAMRDVAGMAKEALDAQEAVVAVWNPAANSWSATTSVGERVHDALIGHWCSRSVLERVRTSGGPVEDVWEGVPSESIARLKISSVIGIPLYWWDVRHEQPERYVGGCLYAHRTHCRPFSADEVRSGQMIARIVQPMLNLLRYVGSLREDLEAQKQEVERLQHASPSCWQLATLSTRDRAFANEVLEPLRQAARANRVGVLLLGPTGVGKSTIAEAFHLQSKRRNARFVVVNCAEFTSDLAFGTELFGYGPKTGFAGVPLDGRAGKALLAHGGTLFIDEIDTIPLGYQQRLLRLCERGLFTPMGGTEERHVDIQVIAASNKPLDDLVRKGLFREDLYWRLSDVVVRIPALTDRPADIPSLSELFFERACERHQRPHLKGISSSAMRQLLAHDWSRAGNVRGLERVISTAVALAPDGATHLDPVHLRLHTLETQASLDRADGPGSSPPGAPVDPEVLEIAATIRRTRSARKAAEALGLTYKQLYYRLDKHNLTVRDVLIGWEPKTAQGTS